MDVFTKTSDLQHAVLLFNLFMVGFRHTQHLVKIVVWFNRENFNAYKITPITCLLNLKLNQNLSLTLREVLFLPKRNHRFDSAVKRVVRSVVYSLLSINLVNLTLH